MKHHHRKDGSVTTTRTQKYICQQRRNGIPCKCPGQHTYLAEKLDQRVIAEITLHLAKLWNKDPHTLAEEKVRERMSVIKVEISNAGNRKQTLEREIKILQAEIIASMEGKSKFPAEQIQQMYTQCQKELDEETNQLANLYTSATL